MHKTEYNIAGSISQSSRHNACSYIYSIWAKENLQQPLSTAGIALNPEHISKSSIYQFHNCLKPFRLGQDSKHCLRI